MRTVLLTLFVACGGATTQANPQPLPQSTADKTYDIHLNRESHVGARTHVVLDATEDTTTVTTKDGAEIDRKREHKVTHFDATSTTAAVNAKNESTRVHYDVTDLVVDGKSVYKGPVDLTRASKADDAVILVNGAPAEGAVRSALKDILSLRVGGPSDDDIFGTKERQAVGAHWPMNSQAALADIANDPKLRASTVTGESTLAAVTDCCLEVRAKLRMGGLALPSAPAGSTVDGNVDATFAALLPTDVKRGRVEDHMGFHMVMKMTIPTAKGPVVVALEATNQKDGHFSE
jgi:hypothetical protein